MPILASEPELFPEQLFDDLPQTDCGERLWWVVHTRPRQEKSLARELFRGEIPFYLPLIPRRRRYGRRVMTSHVPVFDGYVFLFAEPEERSEALAGRRILHTIRVPDQERLQSDLRQIQQLIASGAPLSPEERMVPGKAVEIRNGPLAGLRGTIFRRASRRRFVVQVDFIQRGASVLLDDFDLIELN